MFAAVRGGTLLYPVGPSHHLMILLTDPVGPPGFILTVTVCTVGHARPDSTCILVPGDHQFITHESFVYYRDLREDIPAQRLIDGVKKGEFTDKGPMRSDVLERVLAGVRTSPFAAPFAKKFLDNIARPGRR
jgi:hypothetical protein